MKHFLTLLLFINGFSFSQAQSQLGDNKTFRKCFTTEEIVDLQKLFDFFNTSICSDDKNENLDTCYQRFFRRMLTSSDLGAIDSQIDFEKQRHIYSDLEPNSFNQIWNHGIARSPQTGEEWESIYFNPSGKYLRYLKKVGQNDKMVEEYFKRAQACGDICPTMVAALLVNYHKFNTEDIRVKFIVAIQYLTLNDHRFEKEKN